MCIFGIIKIILYYNATNFVRSQKLNYFLAISSGIGPLTFQKVDLALGTIRN